MSNHQIGLLREAYRILADSTPLTEDCGKFCGAACCHGEAGMWLFPGEAAFFQDVPGFTVTDGRGNEGYPFLLCQHTPESCPRTLRPLSCRIFPLFPYIIANDRHPNRVRVAVDARALRVCPLLKAEDMPEIDAHFRLRVERVGHLLMRDPETAAYLKRTSAFLGELAAML